MIRFTTFIDIDLPLALSLSTYVSIYVFVLVDVCVSVCVCVKTCIVSSKKNVFHVIYMIRCYFDVYCLKVNNRYVALLGFGQQMSVLFQDGFFFIMITVQANPISYSFFYSLRIKKK